MKQRRKAIPIANKQLVLHEADYLCANPSCRSPITLDFHHIEYVGQGGTNETSNLLALCPNCHRRHHGGDIPVESVRAWKMLLVALNEGFDKKAINILLALDKVGVAGLKQGLGVSGEGFIECAGLIASGLVNVRELSHHEYQIELSTKGRLFLDAWKKGRQDAAVNAGAIPGKS